MRRALVALGAVLALCMGGVGVACGSSDSGAPPTDTSADAGASGDAASDAGTGAPPFDAAFQDVGSQADANPCALIDFETVPGATVADGLAIDTQYRAQYHVSFRLSGADAAPPILAQVGNPPTAFYNDQPNLGDTPAPGQHDGMFFLTDDGVIQDPPAPLVITYEEPVGAAYGEVLDIDGNEEWTVEARDANGNVLDSVVLTAGKPGTGDAIATPFSFQHATADIHSLRIRYTGEMGVAVGLAFDNFSPACSTPIVK